MVDNHKGNKVHSILNEVPIVRTNGLQSAAGVSCKAMPVDDNEHTSSVGEVSNATAIAKK